MNQQLHGVSETMLIPLWARAEETRRKHPIIRDEKAVTIVQGMDYDFGKFRNAWLTQVGVSVRSMLLDEAAERFLRLRKNVVVINLGAGLDTRFERLNCEAVAHWYDVDVPEGIALRRRYFSEGPNNTFIAASMFDEGWLDAVEDSGEHVLIIAEGLLMYFTEDELKPLFRRLAERFPHAEMLIELLPPFLVGKGKKHESVSKVGDAPEFKWSPRKTRELETWHNAIQFVEEWNLYDYHKGRWKWFGYLGRMPVLRPRLACRIARLRFS
ncbi:class I SAM-dependent methyltransferase [Oceanidesulfovibrio marinus]|uniref:Class I SAM-dependent methyltransferase n=1 Tax=Oceanidesulfovibrio marinus TaxID=370038 RepID=A0A6P1ZLA0_9BACT|nr:class I SAM-dependent methyltransferase [Oceanidesulfovibrio marinus]TVM36576.1 class I SAM-dependent methyltransferase [Oceanidesulfovibrio marinus]